MSAIEGYVFSFVEDARAERENQAQLAKYGGGWLVSFALAMGEVMNKINDEMMGLAKELDKAAEGDEPANELTALLTAKSQLFKMVSEATSNAIKAVGEGNTSLARKQ